MQAVGARRTQMSSGCASEGAAAEGARQVAAAAVGEFGVVAEPHELGEPGLAHLVIVRSWRGRTEVMGRGVGT